MDQLIGVFAILVLVGGTLLVLAPFFTALLWGAILAYSTWRPFKRLTAALGDHGVWAAVLIVVLILGVIFGPVFYASFAFSAHAPDLVESLRQHLTEGLPPLPDWLADLPLIGSRIDDAWSAIAERTPEMMARLRELAGPIFKTALHAGLVIVNGLGLLALSVLFAFFFYIGGENVATILLAAMQRIAGERGRELLTLVGGTVKGVVYGILGTSFIQAVLCGIGYWISGLPSPAVLGLVTFFLAMLPAGPLLIIVPGAIWLTQNGNGSWAIFLVIWTVAVGISVDNVLKPILIGKSSHMPFILIMLGVLGGAVAFGFLGIFIGPTLLAVAHAVLREWTAEKISELEAQPVPVEAVSAPSARRA